MSDPVKEAFQDVEKVTRELSSRLDSSVDDHFEALVSVRERLVNAIEQHGLTVEQKANYLPLLTVIQEHDARFLAKMMSLKEEAAQDSFKMPFVRKQRSAYEVILTSEGYFFDKRK